MIVLGVSNTNDLVDGYAHLAERGLETATFVNA